MNIEEKLLYLLVYSWKGLWYNFASLSAKMRWQAKRRDSLHAMYRYDLINFRAARGCKHIMFLVDNIEQKGFMFWVGMNVRLPWNNSTGVYIHCLYVSKYNVQYTTYTLAKILWNTCWFPLIYMFTWVEFGKLIQIFAYSGRFQYMHMIWLKA